MHTSLPLTIQAHAPSRMWNPFGFSWPRSWLASIVVTGAKVVEEQSFILSPFVTTPLGLMMTTVVPDTVGVLVPSAEMWATDECSQLGSAWSVESGSATMVNHHLIVLCSGTHAFISNFTLCLSLYPDCMLFIWASWTFMLTNYYNINCNTGL